MRLITQADEELLRTLSLAMRLSTWKRVSSHLYKQYLANPENAETSFAYAVCCLVLFKKAGNNLELHSHFSRALEALSDVLDSEPEHWLARYQRARLRAMIPSDYGGFGDYLKGELTRAVEDLEVLIDQQRAEEPRSYFACPYLLLAQSRMSRSEEQEALDAFAQAQQAVPLDPVPFASLSPILSEPFVQFYYQLKNAGRDEELGQLRQMMRALFPQEPLVATTLAS